MYFGLISAGLVVAGLLNAYDIRSLILVFLSCFFLLILPSALPAPDAVGIGWFAVLIAAEALFAASALMVEAPAARVIASINVWNIAGHLFGLLAFTTDSPSYFLYSWIIQGGEIAQILALILFSKHITRLAVAYSKKGKRSGGQFRAQLAHC